jgi:GR25 family glycosyltransferase involved in LPS biosynthesis
MIAQMHGLYINLNRATVRRRKVEAELTRVGLKKRYRRFSGIADSVPYNGCSRSHINAIREAGRIGGIVHIIEDDVLISDRVAPFLASTQAAELLQTYDILFLSMWVDPDPVSLRYYQTALAEAEGDKYGIVDMRGPRIGAMDSYVVAPRSIDRVAELMTAELNTVRIMFNDSFLDRQVKSEAVSAATVVPFLTCIDLDTGTRSALQSISRDEQTRYVMLRTSFFADKDRQPSFRLRPLAEERPKAGDT